MPNLPTLTVLIGFGVLIGARNVSGCALSDLMSLN